LAARTRVLLGRLGALLDTAGAPAETRRRLDDLAGRLDDLLLVVVVGEFNAGKSSVLNAIFGARVMEEGPVPTTDRITVLRYGEREEAHRTGELVVERRLPHPLLRGLALVDTPGTNSIVREHQALTEDFIPRADLVLFVTSYDRPLSESEREFLAFIRGEWGKRLVVIVNKADLAAGDTDPAAALQQVLAHVREGFARLLDVEPRVFAVAARPALAAKLAHPENPAADPRWAASGFGALETFLTDALTDRERLALKLAAPLDAADTLLADAATRLDARGAVVDRDAEGLAALAARFDTADGALADTLARALAEADRELLEMERRGSRFLDDTIRLGRIPLLRDRDRFREEFQRQVIGETERRVEERTGEAVDGLLRHVHGLWNDTYRHLAEQQRRAAEAGDGAGGPPGEADGFLYNRDEVFRDVAREAKRGMDAYDLREEARRLLENARATATLSASAGAAGVAVGAGAAAIAAATAATALDVTGGFVAAGVLAVVGLVLLPRHRRKAVNEFSARVESMRTEVARALRAQFEAEATEAVSRVRRLVEPLERHVAAQRAALEAAATEREALRTESAAVRAEVRERFGEPSAAGR
ncbi:MAG TPA: dynamin family protein, partial [Rhodothermales bacterium]|nr:dynamin family protein [Rhodothermales bacterium]